MSYRANVTNKEQGDMESASNDSAIRLHHFDGKQEQVGQSKFVSAYDLQAQGNTGGSSNDASKKAGGIIGSHNDKAHLFLTPGR